MNQFDNPFQDYLNDLMTRTENAMPVLHPICRDCGQPITGEAYNHRCGPCARQLAREDTAEMEQNWKEANRER